MRDCALLLGNEAIAQGLLEAGVEVATAYPGTPSTEILAEVLRQREQLGVDVTAQWAINEKVAFDVALAAAMCGKRAAVAMKQVGLNVASDSLLSAAYTGVVGGFVVIACDDPGPHSSQTEQDTRLFAIFAKVPVLDPSSPREARDMVREAFALSERHRIPVLLRPTTRVCHARQTLVPEPLRAAGRRGKFHKDPARWAATPRFRHELHKELNAKLDAIRQEFEDSPFNVEVGGNGGGKGSFGILAAGHAGAVVRDVLAEEGLEIPVLQVGTTFPLPLRRIRAFTEPLERVLVLEEPDHAIEIQIEDRARIEGRLSGHVPRAGELTPEIVAELLGVGRPPATPVPEAPGPAPRLCLGCGHRAAFLALHKALPRAIYAGDIGCYTLGVNQETLDTCLDMGASITLAEGFFHAHRRDDNAIPIVAVIGDSTFFHSGLTGLLNCATQDARIVVVILDNGTVAMTGAQPTPPGADIEKIVDGLGIRFVRTIDPYAVDDMVALVREAHAFTKRPDGGVAVVVARRPCARLEPPTDIVPVTVLEDDCTACSYCLRFLSCPALVEDATTRKVRVDELTCIACGMCLLACPLGAIVPVQKEEAQKEEAQ